MSSVVFISVCLSQRFNLINRYVETQYEHHVTVVTDNKLHASKLHKNLTPFQQEQRNLGEWR
jgi:hypothetical protein